MSTALTSIKYFWEAVHKHGRKPAFRLPYVVKKRKKEGLISRIFAYESCFVCTFAFNPFLLSSLLDSKSMYCTFPRRPCREERPRAVSWSSTHDELTERHQREAHKVFIRSLRRPEPHHTEHSLHSERKREGWQKCTRHVVD